MSAVNRKAIFQIANKELHELLKKSHINSIYFPLAAI